MTTFVCPKCGQPLRGTLETLKGVALAIPVRRANGSIRPEYQLETVIDWETQRTVEVNGEDIWVCALGHQTRANLLFERADE